MNELKFEELQEINGGKVDWRRAGEVLVGTVSMGSAPFAVMTLGPGAAVQMAARGWELVKGKL